jgi:hypothetical protein
MRSGQLVTAVRSQHQERLLGQCSGQCWQQLDGGLVGPLQVVEEERGRLPSRDGREC